MRAGREGLYQPLLKAGYQMSTGEAVKVAPESIYKLQTTNKYMHSQEAAVTITDKYHKNKSISAGEKYSIICVEWAGDDFGRGLIHFSRR